MKIIVLFIILILGLAAERSFADDSVGTFEPPITSLPLIKLILTPEECVSQTETIRCSGYVVLRDNEVLMYTSRDPIDLYDSSYAVLLKLDSEIEEWLISHFKEEFENVGDLNLDETPFSYFALPFSVYGKFEYDKSIKYALDNKYIIVEAMRRIRFKERTVGNRIHGKEDVRRKSEEQYSNQ